MSLTERDKLRSPCKPNWGQPSVPAQKQEMLADATDKQGADSVLSAQASGEPSARATVSGLPATPSGKVNSPVTCIQQAKQALGLGERSWKATKAWREAQREPTVRFFTDAAMWPVMERELDAMQASFDALQYNVDHTACCVKMISKMVGQKVKGRILFDKGNFFESSCARQAPRVKELWDNGCEMKVMKPKSGSGFACMHVKTIIFDAQVLLTGSVNITHNGMENNVEQMYRIVEPTAVADAMTDFEKRWEVAETVTNVEIVEMMSRHYKREERKERSQRSRSQSQSRPRVNRSLSTELAVATE